jgi:hypothetical protein
MFRSSENFKKKYAKMLKKLPWVYISQLLASIFNGEKAPEV